MQRGSFTVEGVGADATTGRILRAEPAVYADGDLQVRLLERTRPRFGWAALTATELKVALLIAEGHSNRSAAAALYVSPHTISSHLRSVFSKLEVNSRVQLTLLVVERQRHQGVPGATGHD